MRIRTAVRWSFGLQRAEALVRVVRCRWPVVLRQAARPDRCRLALATPVLGVLGRCRLLREQAVAWEPICCSAVVQAHRIMLDLFLCMVELVSVAVVVICQLQEVMDPVLILPVPVIRVGWVEMFRFLVVIAQQCQEWVVTSTWPLVAQHMKAVALVVTSRSMQGL